MTSGRSASSAGASALASASATGGMSRPSTKTGVQPCASARRATARSSVLLPIPPGPWTMTTEAGGSSTHRRSKNSSSCSLPTKRPLSS